MNELLVNVSGQIALSPLAFAPPTLVSLTPTASPTAGGNNLTLVGFNLGLGDDFTLAFESERSFVLDESLRRAIRRTYLFFLRL